MPRIERTFRVDAVVVRHFDWGEADRIVTLFSRERGKFRAIVKGARRIKSRKAGHLEPFTRVILQLAVTRDLPIITQAETVDPYLPLREDLVRLSYASYVLELIDRFFYEEEVESYTVFNLLTDTLARISSVPEAWLSIRYYEMRLLDSLGFRPHLFECANCGRDIEAVDQYFSAMMGGVICPRCGAGLPGLWTVDVDTLKYLRHFQRSTFEVASRASVQIETQKKIETIMQAYLTFLLEKELNTPGFLKSVKN